MLFKDMDMRTGNGEKKKEEAENHVHCFFLIFFYNRAYFLKIAGEKRIKKCEKTLDSAYGFHHSVATMNGR